MSEIETLLAELDRGRIACNAAGERPYLVPLAYAYDGESIYAVSGPGRKIDLMRADPRVSFEVDRVEQSDRWQSVVADGEFEEVVRSRRDPDGGGVARRGHRSSRRDGRSFHRLPPAADSQIRTLRAPTIDDK